MQEPGKASADRRWLWGATLLVPAVAVLAWQLLPSAPAPDDAGVVRITGAPPPSPPPAPIASATPSAPLTPQRNSERADDRQFLVVHEQRDRAWADRSEAALLGVMRSMTQVDRGSLTARCTTSVCEVSGLAEEDPASGSMGPTWEALERDTAGNRFAALGLERDATTFGTGRVREAFMVYYRRIASPAAR